MLPVLLGFRRSERDDYAERAIEVTEQTKEQARMWVDDAEEAVSDWTKYLAENPRLRSSHAGSDEADAVDA